MRLTDVVRPGGAGRGRRESAFELEALLRQVVDEFGLSRPEQADGERWLLRSLAGRAVAGRMTPLEFARAVTERELRGVGEDEKALARLLNQYCWCCGGRWTPAEFVVREADVRAAAARVSAPVAGPGGAATGAGRQANCPGT
ncbi:hypothetical protein [Kitasatospora sp. CB01950]|uniref:hypothetical protein n=1 Tax=Kitasatospora sp. CB01950 TaxID=1703930 RepID=UPI0009399E90|nr:hypothetical protein [Kitasatospora sp. CB01950]OKJ15702.1 hypothetical protein AMK19_05345 [Kitasatospora sp. CB01950]